MTGPARRRLRKDGLFPAAVLTAALLLTGCLPGTAPPAGAPATSGSGGTSPPSAPPPGTSLPTNTSTLPETPTSHATSGKPAAAVPSVHFTAQGDIGLGSNSKRVLDTIAGLQPQLSLALGDLAYQAGREQEFCDMVTEKLGAEFPYGLVTGNHESDGHDGDIANFIKCLPNRLPGLQGEYGTQWYVDVPEQNPVVRIVMLSPGIEFHGGNKLDYSKNSERWRWTAEALEGAESKKIPWTVVGMHAPCLSIGKYDCVAGSDLTDLLLDKKVDLVLSGHNHSYQRTHQLGISSACDRLVPGTFTEECITDADQTMKRGAGTVFATVGLGGAGLHDVKEDDSEIRYFAAWSGRNRNAAFGTLDVNATPDRLVARFVPAEGYTFEDSLTIRKQ